MASTNPFEPKITSVSPPSPATTKRERNRRKRDAKKARKNEATQAEREERKALLKAMIRPLLDDIHAAVKEHEEAVAAFRALVKASVLGALIPSGKLQPADPDFDNSHSAPTPDDSDMPSDSIIPVPLDLDQLQREHTDTSLFKVKESPGKGKGLFVTRPVEAGELILNEEPIIETMTDIPLVQASIEYLPQHLKAEFMDLSQSCQCERDDCEEETVLRIWNANSVVVEVQSDGTTLSEIARLYQWASRINHSCQPNSWGCSTPDGRVVIWAGRALEAGEEVTIAYCDGTAERRKEVLMGLWQIDCSCELCKAGDATIALTIRNSIQEIEKGRGKVFIERTRKERKRMNEVATWCTRMRENEDKLRDEAIAVAQSCCRKVKGKKVNLQQIEAMEEEESNEVLAKICAFGRTLYGDDIFGTRKENYQKQGWRQMWMDCVKAWFFGEEGQLVQAQAARRAGLNRGQKRK